MLSIRSIAGALFAATVSAPTAFAQSVTFPASAPLLGAAQAGARGARPITRDGFWFSAGLGTRGLGCQDCPQDEISPRRLIAMPSMADLSLGGTLGDRLMLGGGLSVWTKVEDGVTFTASTLEARLRFYPIAEKGFYLAGGFGFGILSAKVYGLDDENGNCVGTTLGLGWDIRVGRNVSITPFWLGTAARTSGASDANFGVIGVAVTIH